MGIWKTLIFVLTVTLLATLTCAAPQIVIYVAPAGADTNPGTIDRPLRSLAVARDTVRAMLAEGKPTGDIEVRFKAGAYLMAAPVEFKPEDSGREGHKVVYRNADALGSARFVGGRKLTGQWTRDDAGVYKINIGTKTVPHTLYVDGVRIRKARFPNYQHDDRFPAAAAPYLVTVAGEGKRPSNPTWVGYKDGDFDPAKLNLDQLRINVFPWGKCDWHRMLCKVTKIDTEQRRIYFDNLDQKNPQQARQRYFLEDDRSFLDAPGEFFFDAKTGWLYLIPHDGKSPSDRKVILPTTTTLVRLRGHKQSPVTNIRFEGLHFHGTNLDSPAPYLFYPDPRAMVVIDHSRGAEIVNCHFSNGGRSAISASGSTHLILYGNWIHHMGMNGILISDTNLSLVSNNRVHDIGYLQLYAECVGLFKTHNVEVSHCELYNSARYGLTVRGHCKSQGKYGYRQGTAASFNNRFHHLKIYDVNQDSGDTGGLHVAQINSRYDPYYNFFDQITIDRSHAVPGMKDLVPDGIFLDWPGQTQHQRFSNIEVTNAQGRPFRTNRNRGGSALTNVSWRPGFDKTKMAYASIGLKPDFPKAYGGKGEPTSIPTLAKARNGVFAHYQLDNDLKDARGLSTANLAGDPQFTSEVKRVGSHALHFDGEEDLLTLTTELRGDFTVALWAKYEKQTAGGSAWRPIVYSGSDFDKGAIVIATQRDGAGDPGELAIGIDSRQTFDISIDDGQWHFLVLTRSGDTWKAYHNGKPLGTGKIENFVPDSMCLQIGGDRDSLEKKDQWKRHFRGYVDDIRTYSYAMTAAEILAMHMDPTASAGASNHQAPISDPHDPRKRKQHMNEAAPWPIGDPAFVGLHCKAGHPMAVIDQAEYKQYINSFAVSQKGTWLISVTSGAVGYAKVYVKRSEDQGNTWSDDRILVYDPRDDMTLERREDFDCEMGQIFPVPQAIGPDGVQRIYQFSIVRDTKRGARFGKLIYTISEDDGRTWGGPGGPGTYWDVASPTYELVGHTWGWHLMAPPRITGDGRMVLPMNASTDPPALGDIRCEPVYLLSENIMTEPDPGKVEFSFNPPPPHGIHVPMEHKPAESHGMEAQVVELADGRLFSPIRTGNGSVYFTISNDGGRTWAQAMALCRDDDGPLLLNPNCPNPLTRLSNGTYALLHCNNDGNVYGVNDVFRHSVVRHPIYVSVGVENKMGREQPIRWSAPRLMTTLEDYTPAHHGTWNDLTYGCLHEQVGRFYHFYNAMWDRIQVSEINPILFQPPQALQLDREPGRR